MTASFSRKRRNGQIRLVLEMKHHQNNGFQNLVQLNNYQDLNPTSHFFCIEVPVPSQERRRSCICVSGVSVLPVSTVFFCWILEMS